MFSKSEKDFRKAKVLIILLIVFSFFSFLDVLAETSYNITTNDVFEIPEKNATISFAVNGDCERIIFENDRWFFYDLQMGDIQSILPLNLQVWAQDCRVTILSCQIYNSTFGGFEVQNARVRFLVEGGGVQFFDLGLNPEEGDWSLVVNGEYKGEGDGWAVSSDRALTIWTGISGNVSLTFYGYPHPFVEALSKEDFLGSHYVIVVLAVAVIVVIILATLLSSKAQKL